MTVVRACHLDRLAAWVVVSAAALCAACSGTQAILDNDAATDAGGDSGAATDAGTPRANAGPDQAVLRGQRVTLDGRGSAGGAGLAYEWSQVKGFAVTLSNNSSSVTTFSAPAEAGDLVFELRVGGGGASDIDTVTVRVGETAGDNAPMAAAGGDIEVPAGQTVRVDGGGSRPAAGGVLGFQWDALVGHGVDIVDQAAPAPDITIPAASGTAVLKLKVYENGLFSSPDFAAVRFGPDVGAVKTAPMVTVDGADEVYVSPGDAVDMNGSGGFDAYTWTQVGGDPVTIAAGDSARASLKAPARVGRLAFAFKAARDGLWSAPAFKVVHVWAREGYQLPIAEAGDDMKVAPKSTAALDGTRSSVDARRTITYRWEQTGGQGVSLDDPTAAAPSFVAPTIFDTLTFMLTVHDGVAWSAPDTVVVRVGTL